MDFCLDKDIRLIATFNELLSCLFTKTNFEPEIIYFVVKENNEGYLIQNPNDFDSMQSICRQNLDYHPRFIIENENIKDFQILEQKGNNIGETLSISNAFEKTWIVKIIGNHSIDKIISERDIGKFDIQQIDSKKYEINYNTTITPGLQEVNFTARAFNNQTNSEFGPLLWVFFKSSQ